MSNLKISGNLQANNLSSTIIDIVHKDNFVIKYYSDGYCEMLGSVIGTRGSISTLTYPQELIQSPICIQRTIVFDTTGNIARGDGLGVKEVTPTNLKFYSTDISNAITNYFYIYGQYKEVN